MTGISSLRIRHDEIDFPALQTGEGLPLLLLHGGGSHAAHFKPLMERLSGRFRAIAYDQRGFGDAVVGERSAVDHAHWAADVVGVLDALGLAQASLVGWSFGCAVAINAAARFPDRISSLILLGAPNPDRAVNVALLEKRHAEYARLDEDARALRIRAELAAQLPEPRRSDEALLDVLVAGRMASPLAMQARTIKGYSTRPDLRAAAMAVQCPSLLVTGEYDTISPPDAAAVLAAAIRAPDVQVVLDCGHYLAAEQPDLLAQIIEMEMGNLSARSE